MKQTIILIALFASYLAATGQETQLENKPIETGFVFIDGKYIEPPYTFNSNDTAIYLNNLQIKKIRTLTYGKELIFDHDPGIPSEINKKSTLSQFFTAKEPSQGKDYFMAVQGYYYSHFSSEEANLKLYNYIKNLPNVKNLTIEKGLWTIESYSGEKRDFIFSGSMEIMNKIWGPEGSGLPSNEKNKKSLQVMIDRYKKLLNSNQLIIFSNSKDEYYFSKITTIKVLSDIINIADSNILEKSKVDLLIKKNVFSMRDTGIAAYFIKNYNISNESKLKIKILIKNTKQNDTNNIFNKEEKSQIKNNCNLNKQQKTKGNSIVKSVSSNDVCYSPYGKKIIGISPLENDPVINFNQEFSEVISYVDGEGYAENSTDIEIYTDGTIDDDLYGTLSYNTIKYNSLSSDIIYLTSHGNELGICMMYMTSRPAIFSWLGLSDGSPEFIAEHIIIAQVADVYWSNAIPDQHPWVAVATSDWFLENWRPDIDASKSIVFLSCCKSYLSGSVSACSSGNNGSVAFGYMDNVLSQQIMDNNSELLNRMNGTINTTHRRASDAFYDNWTKKAGFLIYPISANNTLAPGIKDYYPKNNNQVSSHGDGFIELDTWCAVNIADNPVTFSTTSNVTISNIALLGEGNRTNKITFHWAATDNADWEVTATIDHTKIKSWPASAESHLLDADNVSPNDQPFTYKFRNASTIASLSFNGVIPDANPLEIEFTPVSNYSPNSFDWNFGDGSTSIESNPKHTYLSFGVYDVYLTAANSSGTSKTISQTVAVLDPSATTLSLECDQYPYSPQINQEVSIMGTITYGFNDGVSYTYLFQIFNNNNQVVYQEETTTSAPQAIIYTSYSLVGYYHIELTVFNNYSFSDNGFIQSPQFYVSDEVVTTQLMTTDFTITGNLNPNNYLTLTPSASGGLAPYHYFWQFGEDPVSGGGNYLGTVIPTNANGVLNNVFYPVAGIYPVWLFATDANMNSAQYYFEINIVEVNPPPVTFAPIIVEATPCMISHSVLGYGLSEYFVAANNTILGFGFELPYNTGLDACLGNGVWELSNLDWYDDGIRTQYCYNQNGNCMWEANSIYHFIPNTGHPNYFSSGYHYVKAEAYSIQGDGLNHCTGSKTIKVGIVDCSNPAYYSSNFFSGAMKYPDVNPIYISAGSLYVDQDILFNNYVNSNAVTLEACNEIVINHEFTTGSKKFILQGIPDPADCNTTQINNNDLSANNPTNRSMSHSSENNISETTDINEKMKNNTSLELEVFPNPAKDNTTIRFKLPNDDDLEITLIDMLGRKLNTIANSFTYAGEYELLLNTVNLSESIYTIVLKFGNQIKYIKLNKLRNL